MPKAKQAGHSEPERKLLQIPMNEILEPEMPARETMDGNRLDDLKESLSEVGMLNPILVTMRGAAYEVVAGHRRYLAARALGWKTIPATLYENAGTAKEAAMLHENVVREDLNPAEEAVFIAELMDKYNLDEEGICRMIKRGAHYIADRLRLLRNDPQVFQALREGKVTFATARELNKFDDEGMRRYHLDAAVRSGCASRVVTQWLNDWRANRVTVNAGAEPQPQIAAPVQIEAPRYACEFCGGDKDPYNFVNINVHRWELEEIKKILRRGAAEMAEGEGG